MGRYTSAHRAWTFICWVLTSAKNSSKLSIKTYVSSLVYNVQSLYVYATEIHTYVLKVQICFSSGHFGVNLVKFSKSKYKLGGFNLKFHQNPGKLNQGLIYTLAYTKKNRWQILFPSKSLFLLFFSSFFSIVSSNLKWYRIQLVDFCLFWTPP